MYLNTSSLQGFVRLVNLDASFHLGEHLGIQKLGLIPLYKGKRNNHASIILYSM
jgi:hypothetical protein